MVQPLGEETLGAFLLVGVDADAHVGARVEVEELPLLLVGFVVDVGVDPGYPETRGDLIGGLTFIERRDSNELFHRCWWEFEFDGLGVCIEMVLLRG